MINIIVACASDEKNTQYTSALESAGYSVFRSCHSGSEVKRTLNQCGDGILITACRLPDCTADTLAWDLGKRALVLVVGRPDQLELCEHPDIFRLPLPCSRGELTSAVNMLLQLYQMRLPRRSGEEKQQIAEAKEYLMLHHALSEPEAHRFLQKGAMSRCMKLSDFAAEVLKEKQS